MTNNQFKWITAVLVCVLVFIFVLCAKSADAKSKIMLDTNTPGSFCFGFANKWRNAIYPLWDRGVTLEDALLRFEVYYASHFQQKILEDTIKAYYGTTYLKPYGVDKWYANCMKSYDSEITRQLKGFPPSDLISN